MKTSHLLLLLLLHSSALPVMGQQNAESQAVSIDEANISSDISTGILSHGYRGFVDFEAHTNFGVLILSTSHGYQFNPNLYVGTGVGYMAVIGGHGPYAFLDLRYDFAEEKNSPFFNIRVLHSSAIQPKVGYRFNHLNLGASCWIGREGSSNLFMFSIGRDFGGRRIRKR